MVKVACTIRAACPQKQRGAAGRTDTIKGFGRRTRRRRRQEEEEEKRRRKQKEEEEEEARRNGFTLTPNAFSLKLWTDVLDGMHWSFVYTVNYKGKSQKWLL